MTHQTKKDLFFSPQFLQDLNWQGKYQLQVGSVQPHNRKQIAEGMQELSSTTIRNRFMGSKKDFTEKELEYLTVLDGWNHYALGLVEKDSQKGVAVVRMVRYSQFPEEAEVAILIVDRYQKLGLGSFLLDLLVLAAMERQITRFSFTFLLENDGIQKLIKKLGEPRTGSFGPDVVQKFIDFNKLDQAVIKRRLAPHLPGIETFHLRT